jgi:hypothetical protein
MHVDTLFKPSCDSKAKLKEPYSMTSLRQTHLVSIVTRIYCESEFR